VFLPWLDEGIDHLRINSEASTQILTDALSETFHAGVCKLSTLIFAFDDGPAIDKTLYLQKENKSPNKKSV